MGLPIHPINLQCATTVRNRGLMFRLEAALARRGKHWYITAPIAMLAFLDLVRL